MAAHRCRCPHCAPAAFPPEVRSPGRTEPGHFAARFGRQDYYLTPYLDGACQWHAVEIMAGPDGWLLALTEPPHRCCGCQRDWCYEVRRGAVVVRGTLGPDGRMRAEGDAA